VVTDLSGFYNFGNERQHQVTVRIENISDEVYATRIDRGTLDASGDSYLFENLGMSRTLHMSYAYSF
jgi:hypothetical protein